MQGEAKKENISVKQYIKENDDPCSNVMLLGDIAGVLGVTICAASIWLSQHFNNYLIDAMGSFLISIVIGSVSFFIQKQNIDKLLGQALPYEKDN
ncbi:zinc transporter 9-like [Dreissena polymorpha]|uniref:zinc transporter 9-like n=1 Tax=Dreissena polymorpha TaxID=45954 RepID=UPI0022644D4F|nr:zinc transporter 9-like [Dreissena polymorpha]